MTDPASDKNPRRRAIGYAVIFLAALVFAVVPNEQVAAIEAVPVPDHMRACQTDADCGFVETTCSSCCGYVGINWRFEQAYYAQVYTPACSGYGGAVCECVAPRVMPLCRQGLCELIERPGDGAG